MQTNNPICFFPYQYSGDNVLVDVDVGPGDGVWPGWLGSRPGYGPGSRPGYGPGPRPGYGPGPRPGFLGPLGGYGYGLGGGDLIPNAFGNVVDDLYGNDFLFNGDYPSYTNNICNCAGDSVCLQNCITSQSFKYYGY